MANLIFSFFVALTAAVAVYSETSSFVLAFLIYASVGCMALTLALVSAMLADANESTETQELAAE